MAYQIKTRTNGVKFVEFVGLDGRRKRLSLGTRDPKIAEELGRRRYIAHIKGEDREPTAGPKHSPERKKVLTLGMAIERMKKDEWAQERVKSWESIWSDCRKLAEFFGEDTEVADITYERMVEYVRTCRSMGHSNGTIKKRMQRLRQMLLNCANGKWINPETRLPYLAFVPATPETGKPSIRKAELTVEDERRVYEYCDQRRADSKRGQQWWLFKQFIMWQIDTGMRKCETLLIDLDRVRHNIVQIRVSKNGEGRDVPLTSRLIKMVDIFRAMDHKGPLFAGLTFGKIQEMWDECRRALDLGDLVIHDLRHTRGQRLCDAGVPLEVVSELLGHKDIGVTGRVYTIRKTAALQQWAKFAEENPDAALTGEFQLKVVS